MIVLDANVIVSGLVWRDSVPGRILAAVAAGQLAAAAPDSVRREVMRVLRDTFQEEPEEAAGDFDAIGIHVVDFRHYADRLDEAVAAIADPTDAPLIALALVLGAPVVSGDRAFHPLRQPLVATFTPRQWLDAWQADRPVTD